MRRSIYCRERPTILAAGLVSNYRRYFYRDEFYSSQTNRFHFTAIPPKNQKLWPKRKPTAMGTLGLLVTSINLRSKVRFPENIFSALGSYSTMFELYTARQLSYSNDIENALSGLASVFEMWCNNIPMVQGMRLPVFSHFLNWIFSIDDRLLKVERGRAAFPSCSWIRWVSII